MFLLCEPITVGTRSYCIAIGEGFHMVHNGCSSIEFPHCQHSTCTNAHRSSIASTIVDVASTRPEPFVQYFSICELCSACIDNAISSNDHPAHGGASWCVIWLARPILLGMTLQDFLLPSDVPLLESWLLPISIVLAQDSWPLTLSMFSSFSFGMRVYMCMWMYIAYTYLCICLCM